MIIPDDTPHSPTKTRNDELPPEYAPPSPPPGPRAVPASSSQPLRQQVPVTYGVAQSSPYSHEVYQQHVTQPQRRSALKRFFKAFFVAVLIWVLVGVFIGSLTQVRRASRRRSWPIQQAPEYPIPDGVDVNHCLSNTNVSMHTDSDARDMPHHMFFDLPVDSKTLYFLASGTHAAGSVEIVSTPDITDKVVVDIMSLYEKTEVAEQTKICRITRGEGENGIGFFTPHEHDGSGQSPWDKIFFFVKVSIPESEATLSRRVINSLETNLPNFGHIFGDLGDTVHFNKLSIKTTNYAIVARSLHFDEGNLSTTSSSITVDDLEARSALLRATNGPINGHFRAHKALVLKTSNAPIKAAVTLGEEDEVSDGMIVMSTSNAPIEATIDLISESKGTFGIDTRTSNAQLDIKVASMPLDATLKYEGRTSNKFVDIRLPASYEGAFDVATSNKSPSIELDDERDPAGRGREARLTVYRKLGSRVVGTKYWDLKNEDKGMVSVKTSNGPLTLHF